MNNHRIHTMIICKFNKWQKIFLIFKIFLMITINNWVKVLFNALFWPSVYGWQVVENKS
jgi:hypothetical protein